jgi:WD40 repeat protein
MAGGSYLVSPVVHRPAESTRSHDYDPDRHSFGVWALAFAPDDRTLLGVGQEAVGGTVGIWRHRLDGPDAFDRFGHQPGGVLTASLSSDQSTLLTGDNAGNVILWDVRSKSPLKIFHYPREIASVRFSPEGGLAAIAAWDGTVHIRKVDTGGVVQQLATSAGATEVVFTPDGSGLLTYFSDKGFTLWNVETGIRERVFGSDDYVTCADFSPDGRKVCSGEFGVVRVWDFATGQELSSFDDIFAFVHVVAFSPDGQTILGGDRSGANKVWNVDGAVAHREFKLPSHASCVTFTTDSRFAAVYASNLDLFLLDLNDGSVISSWPVQETEPNP